MIWQNKESTAMEYCYVFRRQWALHFHHGLISHSRLNWKCSVIPISLFWFLKGHNKYSLRVKWVICPGHRPLYIYIKLECTFTISWTIEISHLPSCLDVCTHQCLTIYMHNVFFFFFFHKTIITQILIFNPLAQADSLNKITPIPRVGEMKRTRIKNGQTSFFSHTLPGSGLDHDPSVCAA